MIMKKLNILFAILIAVLGVSTLSAQTNIIADWDGGSNTGKPTTFGWASSYGSRSWGELNGGGARVTNNYSGYKKEDGSTYSYVKDSEPSTQILWIRYESNKNETYTYTFTGLEVGKVYTFSGLVGWHNNSNAPTFTITVNGDKELAKVSKYCGTKQMLYPFSVDFMVPADNKSENFTLTFKSNQGGDNMEALSALSIVESSAFANASQDTPYDITSWLKDPSFENNGSGWDMTTTYTNWGANAIAGDAGKLNKQQWNGNFEVSQTLNNIPNGTYRLSVQGFYRPGGNEATSTAQNAVLYANDTKTGLMLVSAGGKDTQDNANGFTTAYTGVTPNVYVPNSQNDASKAFSTGAYSDNIVKVNVTNNSIKLGVKKETHIGNDWTVIDNFKLEYLGYDLSEALNALNALVATAQGVIDANEVSPQSVLNLQAAIEAANSVQQTEAAIAEASTALTETINAANTTIAACNEYKSMLALSESMYTNSTADDKSTFEAAINKAKSDFNAAANVDAISAIVTDLQNAQKAYCLVAAPTEGHPFDMTWLVVNPKFDEGTKGWTSNTSSWSNTIATNQGGAITGNYYENWNESSYTGEIYQQLENLPKGKYVLTAAAFRDQLTGGAVEGDAVYVFANDQATLVTSATPDFYSVEVSTTTGTLIFGVKSVAKVYKWMGIDNVTLKYVAGLDLSEFTAAYTAALEEAKVARDNEEYSKVGGAEKAALLAAIAVTPEQTQESLGDATEALISATAKFKAAKGDYDVLEGEINTAKGLGMTDAAINAITNNNTGAKAYTDLKVAEYNYIQDTYTENVTLGSWTEDFASDLDGEGYKVGGPKYLDDWQGNKTTRTTKQTVTLPAGDYALSVIARGQAGASGNLYYKIGDVTTDVALIMKGNRGRGVDVNGIANFSEEGEYNCNGEGFGWEYRFITFRLDTETQVEIGASVTIQGQWASVYAPVLLTTEASQKVLLLDEINTLLSDVPSGKMGAAVAAALESAVSVAEGVSNATELSKLSEVASDLRSAVADAKASISGYAKLEGYISMTKVFTDVTQYEQKYENGEFATDDVETVRQELNVLRFNAASEIFPNKIEVTGWEGSMGGKNTSGQHWDGTDTKYYDNNSWYGNAHSTQTSIELPAGTYVLKAALRSHASTTMTLTVQGNVVNVEGKGDQGYGIDTSGAANFSEEGTYANNDNGRGWEWEFVKFELDATTLVTLSVECDYNDVFGWASFSDITLWMDDETYVTVNGGAINAPLAAAKALVDTKPMGVVEKTALQNAIAQAEGTISTPAELDGAIATLETAVANANAWVVAYNEAKAPLVEALERFEADYNKDGVKMSKEVWNNILEKVKAAALAKDVTDSYDGFAVAAEELNAALDAAQASIDAYAALNEVIENANTTANGDNIGDQPFQRPVSAQTALEDAIATAQTAYDKAEADATEVKNTLATAVEVFNNAELNAPAEGQRFYIKVATEGHGKNGNAWLMTLGATSENNPTGYGINANNEVKPHLNQAFIFTQVEGNLYNISIERAEGTVYLTYGELNGSAASWKNQQIQATTDAAKKGEFKIVPTGKNGILKIFNTVDNNYIDCQGGGAIYTDTDMENEEFAFELASEHEVTLNISTAGWATLILPFNAGIPDGVTVYASESVEGELVKLTEVGSIVANTPYLIKGTKGAYEFSGYGLADEDSYKDAKGLFVGTFVDYKTEGGEYVLQNHDRKVAFYRVGDSAKPTVKAYRCYLTASANETKAFFFGDEVTGINGVDAADTEIGAIYTINGTRVNNLQKGLNIVKMSNGKTQKVYVK